MSGNMQLTDIREAAEDLERLHYFAGRHLGEDEFEREQRWREARLAPVLVGEGPGVVEGLQVRCSCDAQGLPLQPHVLVEPGLGIDADGGAVVLSDALRPAWTDIQLGSEFAHQEPVYLVAHPGAEDANRRLGRVADSGWYLLVLERRSEPRDPPHGDPCRRLEHDPLRDSRMELVSRLVAYPLTDIITPPAALPAPDTHRHLVGNRISALWLPEHVQQLEHHGVALALVLTLGGQVRAFDSTPVWRRLDRDGARQALAEQCRAAFASFPPLPSGLSDEQARSWYRQHWPLDHLPAAGLLPGDLIRNITSHDPRPSIPFFPEHIGVDISALPVSQVRALLATEICRGIIDLNRPQRERVRVLLAVSDSDWRPDLMDIPSADVGSIERLVASAARNHQHWWQWRTHFLHIYGHDDLRFDHDSRIVLDATSKQKLGLVSASEAMDPARIANKPQVPTDLVQAVLQREMAEDQVDQVAQLPRPYPGLQTLVADTQQAHDAQLFQAWPSPPVPHDGLLVRQWYLGRFIDGLEEDAEEVATRVTLLRDLAQEIRQAYDAHSVNLTALAGGFAHDGLGFSFSKNLNTIALGRQQSVPEAVSQQKSSDGASTPIRNSLVLPRKAMILAPSSLIRQRPSLRTEKRHPKIRPQIISDGAGGKRLVNADSESEELFGVMRHIRPDLFQMDNAEQTYRQLHHQVVSSMKRCGEWGRTKRPKPTDWDRPEIWKTDFAHVHASRTPASGGRINKQQLLAIGPDKKLRNLRKLSGNELRARLSQVNKVDELIDLSLSDSFGGAVSRKDPHRWLVALGQRMARLLAHVEALLRKWEHIARAIEQRRREAEEELQRVEKELAYASSVLKRLEADRREAEDDYRMAQVLAEEDWTRVEAMDEERSRLLQAPLAVAYVRVQQTPLALPLPDPVVLVHREQDDLVPGCGADEAVELPEELDPFLEAVWEVPMGDWQRLRDLVHYLPISRHLRRLATWRDSRLAARPQSWAPAYARLQPMLQRHQALMFGVMGRVFQPAPSLAESRRRALDSLSIADLLQVRSWHLRRTVQQMHEQWQQAAGCLLARLRLIPSSLRFDWAQLAEDDQLPTENPMAWPGIASAADDDPSLADLRILVQLLRWCWSQLTTQAGEQGRGAVRNLINAVVVHAAHGDVNDIANGQVVAVPTQLHPGVAIRVALDRQVGLGQGLHLLDAQGGIVGDVRVDDHDEHGSVVRLVRLIRPVTALSTAFTVASRRDG